MALLGERDRQIPMKDFLQRRLENFEINLARKGNGLGLTPKNDLLRFLLRFRPKYNGHDLIRVGAKNDGGYLIPDDLKGVVNCLSPGCDLLWAFENQLATDYQIDSYICDSEEKRPANLDKNIHFTPGWIAPFSDQFGNLQLNDWIDSLSVSSTEMILQMDIEGSEYLSLLSLNTANLLKFRIIVLELHFLELLKNYTAFSMLFKPSLERIFDNFDVVHVHPNNCCGEFNYSDLTFPRFIEVTFHRKDRGLSTPENRNTPNHLDEDCVPGNPNLEIDWALLEKLAKWSNE